MDKDNDQHTEEVTPEQREAIDALNAAIDTTNPDFVRALNTELGRDLAERDAAMPNRAERRSGIRRMKRLVINPNGSAKRLHHPLLRGHLMPWGIKEIARRRAAEAVAKKARQINRGGGKRRGSPPMAAHASRAKHVRPEVQGS